MHIIIDKILLTKLEVNPYCEIMDTSIHGEAQEVLPGVWSHRNPAPALHPQMCHQTRAGPVDQGWGCLHAGVSTRQSFTKDMPK